MSDSRNAKSIPRRVCQFRASKKTGTRTRLQTWRSRWTMTLVAGNGLLRRIKQRHRSINPMGGP